MLTAAFLWGALCASILASSVNNAMHIPTESSDPFINYPELGLLLQDITRHGVGDVPPVTRMLLQFVGEDCVGCKEFGAVLNRRFTVPNPRISPSVDAGIHLDYAFRQLAKSYQKGALYILRDVLIRKHPILSRSSYRFEPLLLDLYLGDESQSIQEIINKEALIFFQDRFVIFLSPKAIISSFQRWATGLQYKAIEAPPTFKY